MVRVFRNRTRMHAQAISRHRQVIHEPSDNPTPAQVARASRIHVPQASETSIKRREGAGPSCRQSRACLGCDASAATRRRQRVAPARAKTVAAIIFSSGARHPIPAP
jgi:hypothetical protein